MNLDNYSLDRALRYGPLVRFLRHRDMSHAAILEVGSGDSGLTAYLPVPITGADLASSFTSSKSPLIIPVEVNGVILPFEDASFDVVLSVDMLEHVSKKDRQTSIREMVRVAKKFVLIGVPTGNGSIEKDEVLDQYWQRLHGERFHFLIEHKDYGLSMPEDLLNTLKDIPRVGNVVLCPNVNLTFRAWYMRLWMSKNKLFRGFYRALSVLAPLEPRLSMGTCYRSIYIVTLKND